MRFYLIFLALLTLLLSACGLQQTVDLDLPDYDPQVVVECYLEPGQPYLLTLVESVPYFDEPEVRYLRGAQVIITHAGTSDTLQEVGFPLDFAGLGGLVDTNFVNTLRPLLGDSVFFYGNLFQQVPESYDEDFRLSVRTADGRELSAVTRIPPPIRHDSLEVRFDEDSMAIALTKFPDNPDEVNFYRRVLEERKKQFIFDGDTLTPVDSFYTTEVLQDFVTDDVFFNGQQVTFGSLYEFEAGDTLLSTVYHITGDYFRFIDTRDAAIIANFSPFAQPARLFSNVEGGTGIFTGFSRDQLQRVVGE